jgi:hypothetical protein
MTYQPSAKDVRDRAQYLACFWYKLAESRQPLADDINSRFASIDPKSFHTTEGRIYWNSRYLQEMAIVNRIYGRSPTVENQYLIAMGHNDSQQLGMPEEQAKLLNVNGGGGSPRAAATEETMLVSIPHFRNCRRIAAGGQSSSVITDGVAHWFGSMDPYLDHPDSTSHYQPQPIGQLHQFPEIGPKLTEDIFQIADTAVGDGHMLLLTLEGEVYSSGFYKDSDSGEFTDTGNYKYNGKDKAFHKVTSLFLYKQKVVKIFANESMSAAVLEDGTLLTWGTCRVT